MYWVRYPPADMLAQHALEWENGSIPIGPIAGPMNGITLYTAVADPRSFFLQQSLKTPPPIYPAALASKSPLETLDSSHTACGALPPRPLKNRNARICCFEVANPQTVLNTRYTIFADCRITTRPYISDSGARTKGPSAYASRKIDMTRYRSMPEVMVKSLAIWSRAGATIVDETGEMKVKQETSTVADHFRLALQFRGFVGSEGEDQVTWILSLDLVNI